MLGIKGSAKNVRDLLANARYEIDFYQRRYLWEEKHVDQLLDDLEGAFEKGWNEHGGATDVSRYERYFLGSILVSDANDGARYIVDGQQRLTTVTLILIALYHKLSDESQRTALGQLIYSYQAGGGEAFNLHVEDRVACMKALFERGEFTDDSPSESAANMNTQYQRLEEDVDGVVGRRLPDEEGTTGTPDPDPARLRVFANWLMWNVYFVEVVASTRDAYAIFETMNDRGAPLAPVDLLKGYLLSQIDGRETKSRLNETWKDVVAELRRKFDDQEPARAVKSWLWSQYAEGATATQREAEFKRIDSEFHRWVRDERDRLGLHASADFLGFIECDFTFYMRWYIHIRTASRIWTEWQESVYRNQCSGLRDRDNLYLAPLVPGEDDETSRRKIRTVAAFIEFLVAQRVWHGWDVNYGRMYRSTEKLTVDIRHLPAPDIANAVSDFPRYGSRFAPRDSGSAAPRPTDWDSGCVRHRGNGNQIHRFLARLTEFIEVESGMPSRFAEYVRTGREGYDVEHIWANNWRRHKEELPQEKEFDAYRDWIAGLVLLPHSTNIALGAKRYAGKRATYGRKRQNLLVRSLVTEPSDVPGFGEFVARSGLPFRPHAEFTKADFEARAELYRQLAGRIWSLDGIRRIAES